VHPCTANGKPACLRLLVSYLPGTPEKSKDLQQYVGQQPKSRKPEVLAEGSENTAVL